MLCFVKIKNYLNHSVNGSVVCVFYSKAKIMVLNSIANSNYERQEFVKLIGTFMVYFKIKFLDGRTSSS